MKTFIITLLLFLFTINHVKAQPSNTEMAFYNIGLGSVVSGVGALINKKPNERWDKVLLKGMGQGALGGYLVYESKNLVGQISKEERWEYAWYSKFVNSAGISIIENAASNRNFWEQWHVNVGFNRLEFYTKDKFKFKYKIMPVAFLLTAAVAIDNKFELGRSLQTGQFIFSNDSRAGSNRGRAYGTTLLIRDPFFNDYDLYAHEILHIYQYHDFNFVNPFFEKTTSRWKEQSAGYSKFSKLFYLDLNAAFIYPAYIASDALSPENLFELEADFYEH